MSALPGSPPAPARAGYGGGRVWLPSGAARITWAHPEWWSLAISAAAWVLLVIHPDVQLGDLGGLGGLGGSVGWSHQQHHHAAMATTVAASATTWPASGLAGWLSGTLHWMVMVLAMMVPLVLVPIRTTASRSLWRRRHRAIAAFLTGYTGLWLAAGGVVSFVLAAQLGNDSLGLQKWTAVGFALAAAWQLTPAKWWAVQACHRTAPLAPTGWRADRDCWRYGWTVAGQCLVSCWAVMLVCVLSGHSIVAMGATSLVTLAERYAIRPHPRLTGGVLAGAALLYAARALR